MAIADCNQALAINPKSAEAYSKRGEAWLQNGENGRALADCNETDRVLENFAVKAALCLMGGRQCT